MAGCKDVQKKIEDFEYGRLSTKEEEAFTSHVLDCPDCREEMEIYYIISYGLDSENEDRMFEPRYAKCLDAFDFTGLVDRKLADSEKKCIFIGKWNYFEKIRYMFVSGTMLMTTLLLVVILFF